MLRKDLYKEVVETPGAAAAIKKEFGRNYTQVSNLDLSDFLKKIKETPLKGLPKGKATVRKDNGNKAIIRLVSTLQAKRYLTAEEANEILALL